mmetsp:Transcript_20193/g.49529  ORF Transcript_20193/g.49529 Transcript_20193/m.49529 type:complete len:212 (+) Transcript_20193:68-703(+)
MDPSQISLGAQSPNDHIIVTEASTMSERSVKFLETVHIQLVFNLDDYTEDEFNACWYSSKEYSKIEKRVMKECDKMEKGKVFKDKKYCSRGLEKFQTCNYISRKETSRKAIQSVLDEQDRQDELEVVDDESISQVYHNVSSSCQMWATVIGFRDQKDAESYIDDDDWEDFTTTPARPPMHSISSPKEKTDISNSMIPMTELRQLAVSARSA